MENVKRCVVLCLHDDWWFAGKSIEAAKSFGPVLAFVSRVSWNGSTGDWQRVAEEAEKAGAEVILGDWDNETLHRRHAYGEARNRGYTYALIPDGDEVIEPKLLKKLVHIAESEIADIVRAHMDTYWKSARYVIRPREQLAPAILINLGIVSHVYIRDFEGGSSIVLGAEHGVIHHLSYAGPDERIQRKITTWSHKHELVQDWYRNVWQAWDDNKTLRDLHPTHPPAYGLAERIEIPEILAGVWDERPVAPLQFDKPDKWPTVSIIIPLHGGSDDIRMCLESLKASQDLIHETIVVDDTSPDDAAEVARRFAVTLIQNEENLGFGRTCNRGLEASTGEVVLFLNSDTIVPRTGLIKLIEGLMESGSIGAAGPMSNNVGYHQRISPTYTSLDTIDLFAADLAASPAKSRDVEILVGFALAVRRTVLDEIGAFDDRFGRGLFEDTDLCYRMSRAGYRLRMVTTAYVHHWGSRTLTRAIPDVSKLLEGNGVLYRSKWQRDLESGYASHLPGFGMNDGLVQFNESRHPDRLAEELEKLRDKAKISLCMIVKNEERVLAQCLASATAYFFEVIVVDTGSTDRTKEIAREFGVKLIESTWPDSFAEARNESLSYATGDWIFWLDADDVLPFSSGEQVLHAALNAPADITGFVVPVQFVEEGLRGGTKVDHVKLIRNFDGIKFEGRIHEQILTSIREHGGEIARLDAVVLHAGYDTSVKGQANKRERDWHLLKLDLADRPEHPFVWFNIGMTHHFTNGHEEAVHALRESIRFSGEHDSHLRKAYSLMGVSYRELGRLDEAKAAFEEGLAKVGEDPELTFQLAMTATALGDLQLAKRLYETMPKDTGGYFSSVDIGILTFKRLHNLGGIKMALGDYVGARKDWEEAFEANPSSTISLVALCDAAIENEDFKTARACLQHLERAEGHSVDWAERRYKVAESAHEPGGGYSLMHQILQANPNLVGPRLMLSRHYLAREQIGQALPHLQVLQGQGVAEAAFMLGVAALRAGDISQAIRWTERAVQLNPTHGESIEQLRKLREFEAVPEAQSILTQEEQIALLTGPDAGTLAPASKRHSIVIVTYNSQEWIQKCLGSVLPTIGVEDEILVVDNASPDGTAEVVEALSLPSVTVIRNAENMGYARAANVGVRASQGQYVTLLNPDTEVSPGWLEGLAARLGEGIGAVGPVSDNIGGDQFVGHYVRPGIPIADLSSVLQQGYPGQVRSTKLLMGMCLMVPREVLNAVGLLDEGLFLGADDLDFSWRLRMLGYDQVVALDVFVHHAGQKSFETRERSVVSDLVAKSDAWLVKKLQQFYGTQTPGSYPLWGCDIFEAALAR